MSISERRLACLPNRHLLRRCRACAECGMTLKFNRQYSPPAELAESLDPEEDLRTLKEVLRAVEALARQDETPEELHRCLKIIHCGATFITPSFEHKVRLDIHIHRSVFISISACCKDEGKPDSTNDASEG
jgi:hypothetical protein